MSFKKVVKVNDWGYYKYKYDNKEIDLSTLLGKKINVKFPNKECYKLKLYNQLHNELVGDHGKEYTVTSTIYYFKIKVLGLQIYIPIENVKVEL